MDIQAVFFDMGGTIETFGFTRALRLEATNVVRHRLSEVGIDLPGTDEQLLDLISGGLSRYKKWSVQNLEELPPLRIWSEYIFAGMDAGKLLTAESAEDLMVLVESRYYERVLRPEVPAVLEAIQGMGLKMGVISNISSLGLVPLQLERYGIARYFSPVVMSSQYGRRKPDPAIFHHAARLAGVPTSACLYIGDRVIRDIDGARRAGFGKAVLIQHDFEHGENDSGQTPDAVISSMTELLDILRAPGAPRPNTGKIRGLIFDAGDLLYYRTQRSEKFKAFLRELGMEIDPNHEAAKKAIEYKAYRGQINHDAYRESILNIYGISQPELVARGKQALIDDDANVTFFEGVPETLLSLKAQGFLLGIVTDTANSITAKLSWFERGGFGHVWDSIISSMDIGVRKPDPSIYYAALRQLGLEPGQAAFVGHRTVELDGARAVGIPTIAFNYDPDARADCYIEQFCELPGAVAALSK